MNLREIFERTAPEVEAALEYAQNAEFNDALDAGDIGEFSVMLQAPAAEPRVIDKMSQALFYGDRPTYKLLHEEWVATQRRAVLRLDQYPENEVHFEELKSLVHRRAMVLPFVGAGFSVDAGCPTWSDYVVSQAVKGKLDASSIKRRLEHGEHEIVMNEVIQAQTLPMFTRDFKTVFENGSVEPTRSPGAELLGLFDSAAVTTNFDRVLEDCHREKGHAFREKVVANDDADRFIKAALHGEKYLLKLHGNIDDSRHRVLTKEEYDRSYAEGQSIPKALTRIFTNFSLLFLGCSLLSDRYLTVLKTVFDSQHSLMPNHFAIVCAPDDEEERSQRDKWLAAHGIQPIWFSDGDWNAPSEILRLLKTTG